MSIQSHRAVYRILDASINRAGEGLRTMEEYARFVLDDSTMTSSLKTLRHGLTTALSILDRESLLAARDTADDVGTNIQVETEYHRSNAVSVIQAAASRTQQSLRVIEEYSKLIDTSVSSAVERVRYRAYTVCADLEQQLRRSDRLTRLAASQLYVLIDAGTDDQDFATKVTELSKAGVDILQLRDSAQSDRVLLERAKIGVLIANQNDTLFIVNDRPDIAAASGADGVHVGQDEMPADAARAIIGTDRLIGVSTHSIAQVHDAIGEGADYIGCGPVFPSRTKLFDEFVGTEFLSEVHDAKKQRALPAFAIGGIEADNVAQVTATGFHRIAVTGAIDRADDRVTAARDLRNRLQAN
ncbi:thiamine phosphate synthase [Planctomycetes bacterium K23_9]|uniref:Thiamine-phosphate synthase n=1 Tax=Stieleria marina TaxID=1930275 RepID=A0A517NLV2_9BACT|nr:Thiamine-phosphate synthase [Planctomycetes bacterium K23_9]